MTAILKDYDRFTQVLKCRVGTLADFVLPLDASNKYLSSWNSVIQRVEKSW